MSVFLGKYAGKGILAADKSTGTFGKWLASIDVENIESNRQALRELLFTTPNALPLISGVILFEETFIRIPPMASPLLKFSKRMVFSQASRLTRGRSI